MHLVIPFAAPLSESGRQAVAGLALPGLSALLALLAPTERSAGDEYQLSPPHERVLAHALGWAGGDGALPWAAQAAAADGIDTGDLAWGLLSPVHWRLGRDAITMGDPEALGLDAEESRAYFDSVRPLFESLGWLTAWGAPTRWYVAHESLAELPTASLDRVIGRNPDLWMPESPAARSLKRLQNETQMLLYTHPLNAAREARGAEPLNSVWLSGCGLRQPARHPAPELLDDLRAPALHEDWAGYAAAWQRLEAGPLADALQAAKRGTPLTLTLCGERHAQSFGNARGWLDRLARRFKPPSTTELLLEL